MHIIMYIPIERTCLGTICGLVGSYPSLASRNTAVERESVLL